jgi:S-disulfanyl-L-cysteine oxidoreductase SoxD
LRLGKRACMKDCAAEPRVASQLPDFARNSHGNLADQQRLVGPQRGALTDRPATVAVVAPAPAVSLAQKHACTACHGVDKKIVGPGLREIAARHAGRADAVDYFTGRIRNGGAGTWGAVAMPAQALPEADARALAQWLADGAKP